MEYHLVAGLIEFGEIDEGNQAIQTSEVARRAPRKTLGIYAPRKTLGIYAPRKTPEIHVNTYGLNC